MLLVLMITNAFVLSTYAAPFVFQHSIGTKQLVYDKAVLDISNVSDGYIMYRYRGASDKTVVQMKIEGDNTIYSHHLPADGGFVAVPLSFGSGSYTIRVYERLSGAQYQFIAGTAVEVSLENEFSPYLYPNTVVDFDADSLVVAKGEEIAGEWNTVPGKIAAIYRFVADAIAYDSELAATVAAGYRSDPDTTLKKGKGICLDYTVLAAAMLRAQGIPTKVVFGRLAGGEYHSWISVYSCEEEQDGPLAIERGWNLLDPTFSDRAAVSRDDYTAIYEY